MQRSEGARPGLVGMQWGIVMPDDWELLVPAHGGLRFSRESDYHPRQFHYPMEWEAQFALIQGKRGGILIHAEDNAQRFKRLFLQRRQGQFWVGFETWCTAPFERVQRAESVRWRIRPYKGGWLHGVALYRQWAEKTFGLAEFRRKQPAWVREIQTVVIDNLDDMGKIEALAKRVNPRQTLIYVSSWRRDGYDRNYPDYTPAEGFAEKMERVRRWGFRIMLHVNYFGCTPENPEYERLKQYHFRDPFTRQPLYWEWPADPPIKFAYINPAAKAWRTLFVQRMVELCRQLKPDALHLDQTLCIYNDANGLIDGMNAMQGNLALHRELLEALPDVALSGEGLNEISFRYEEFAQRHVWGLYHVRQSWDATLVRMAHPVSSALLSPHTRLYGYLGMCSPRMWHYYTAWRTAYDRMGVLPTLAWVDREVVTQPDAALQTLWKEARWFQQHQPVPDFTPSRWGQDTLFVYRTREGRVARFRRDASGVCLEAQGNGGWQTVSRRVEGVSRARVEGSVPYWKAYSEGMLFGLNPDTVYPWTAQPPPRDVTHLSDLGAETVLTAAAVREGEVEVFCPLPLLQAYLDGEMVEGRRLAPSRYRYALPPRACRLVLLFARRAPLPLPTMIDVAAFPLQLETDRVVEQLVWYRHGMSPTVTPEGRARLGLFAHPLHDGRVFRAVLLGLPPHALLLRGTVQSLSGETPLRLSVEVNGREVWNQRVEREGRPLTFEVPLGEWSGGLTLIRFVAEASVNFRWNVAQWSNVRIG